MDLVISNARIWTGDPDRAWADTAVVRDGRFVFVGRVTDWQVGVGSEVRDLDRALVIPGLIDSHTHPASVARSSWHVALPWTHDLAEMLDFIHDYGSAHPISEAPFLYFEYYPSTLFGESVPTKELLDRAISDRPVLCQDFNEHACWVNSRMLALMGVDKNTPDPVPGLEMFARDSDGEPTGHLYEGVWLRFVDRLYDAIGWRPPENVTADNLEPVLRFFSENGITALFDAVLDDEDTIRAVAELDARGKLNMCYQAAPRFRSLDDLPDVISTVRRYQSRYGNDHIRVQAVKLFLDGTNENGNSAVLEPLVNDPCAQDRGAIQMEVSELAQCMSLCNSASVDLHIHLVGDRAFRTACDAVEAAREATLAAGMQWRIQVTFAHCELIDPADMSRPADLGVIVNWTSHWSAGYFGEEARQYLGDARWDRMYEFNAIAASGATLTFSSDVVTRSELHRADPFFGMQVAATRVDPEYPLDPEQYPGSVRPSASATLALELLMDGYTMGGAKQLRIEDKAGSIATGKLANLVVLDDDLFATEPSRISSVQPRAVMFEGVVISGAL